MVRYLIPLFAFVVLLGFFVVGLQNDPRRIPSVLIDKPVPEFNLPKLMNPQENISSEDLKDEVVMINVWGSWCVACVQEHPLLMEFAKTGEVNLFGLNYRDEPKDAINWLQRYGNPYTQIVSDLDGRVGIDFGVYGAPETFILDKRGIIRYKHIGPISKESLKADILPLIKTLKEEPIGMLVVD